MNSPIQTRRRLQIGLPTAPQGVARAVSQVKTKKSNACAALSATGRSGAGNQSGAVGSAGPGERSRTAVKTAQIPT